MDKVKEKNIEELKKKVDKIFEDMKKNSSTSTTYSEKNTNVEFDKEFVETMNRNFSFSKK